MYERSRSGWSKHWDFILLDVLSLDGAFVLAYLVRFQNLQFLASYSYRVPFYVIPILDIVLLIFFDRFSAILRRGFYAEFIETLKHTLYLLALVVFILFALKISSVFSRLFISEYFAFYFCISYCLRVLWKKYLQNTKGKLPKKSVIIVADNDSVQDIIDKIESNNYSGYRIEAVVLREYKSADYNGIPCLKDRFELEKYCLSNWVDEIFVELSLGDTIDYEVINNLETMGISIHFSYPIYRKYGYKVIPEQFAKIPVLTITTNYINARQQVEKRVLDILGGLAGSFITLIFIVIFGPIIKIKSPGPIFFKQKRVGKNGRIFEIIKFRSMYLDAEDRKKELMAQNRVQDGMMFKMEFDPRVIGNYIDENGNKHTGIGEFIRKYSIDEFPQFFNVLAGDMSLVGTRPPTLDEYVKYEKHHKARLACKPGITGMWQISGRSNIIDFEEVVKLDTEYINDWTLGKDIKILLKTVKAVLKKEGSM